MRTIHHIRTLRPDTYHSHEQFLVCSSKFHAQSKSTHFYCSRILNNRHEQIYSASCVAQKIFRAKAPWPRPTYACTSTQTDVHETCVAHPRHSSLMPISGRFSWKIKIIIKIIRTIKLIKITYKWTEFNEHKNGVFAVVVVVAVIHNTWRIIQRGLAKK